MDAALNKPPVLNIHSASVANNQPTVRIGDAERSHTVELLGTHFSAGRLDHPEFEKRVDAALGAITLSDLRDILSDLPVLPQPANAATSGPRQKSAFRGLVALGVFFSFPMLIMMLLGSVLLGAGIVAFALIGGSLAMFCGFGVTWLSVDRRSDR